MQKAARQQDIPSGTGSRPIEWRAAVLALNHVAALLPYKMVNKAVNPRDVGQHRERFCATMGPTRDRQVAAGVFALGSKN